MTQLQKFIELYKEFGIELKVEELAVGGMHTDGYYIILAKSASADKFSGFPGFFSEIHFDLDGNFVRQEFWE
jgi:hypothetical protein